jgi:hypothetical protein
LAPEQELNEAALDAFIERREHDQANGRQNPMKLTALPLTTSTLTTLIRLSSRGAILATILNVLSGMPVLFSESALFWVHRIADISTLIAMIGIALHLRKSLDAFGLIALGVALAGVGLLIFSIRYDLAITIYALGVILLAIALLRTGNFPRWAPVLWLPSILIAMPGFLIPGQETFFSLLVAIVFGLGFIGVGFHLFTFQPGLPQVH